MTKLCFKCKIVKNINDFYIANARKDGHSSWCKTCAIIYRENNKDILSKRKKIYLKNHKEERFIYNKSYYYCNKESIIKQKTERYRNDINLRLVTSLRHRVRDGIQHNIKSAKTKELLGCTIEEFKSHLSSQFKDGMTFDNYGQWHIDHILPIKIFNLSDPTEQKQCFHYTNMQPLWAHDNYTKGAKVEEDN